jgi:hypothetical protein
LYYITHIASCFIIPWEEGAIMLEVDVFDIKKGEGKREGKLKMQSK